MSLLNKIYSPSILVYENNRVIDEISFGETVERIKSPEPEIRKLIFQYRDLWKRKNNYSEEDAEVQLEEIENSLPQFLPGQLEDPYSQEREFKQTELLVINFERLGDVEAAKYRMVQLPSVYCAFISTAGDSLQVIHRFEEPIRSMKLLLDQFYNIYDHGDFHIMRVFCKPNPTLGFTQSFDPDIYFNPESIRKPNEVCDWDLTFYN